MNQFRISCFAALALFVTPLFAAQQPVEIRVPLKNGGSVYVELGADCMVQYHGMRNALRTASGTFESLRDGDFLCLKTSQGLEIISVKDLVSIEVQQSAGAPVAAPVSDGDSPDEVVDSGKPHVYFLPMIGGVGQEFRHDELKMLESHIESEIGDQSAIIVLKIDSNGGLVHESMKINTAIRELKRRHRVVAWLEVAISAGANTAMACDEIVFKSEGNCGSVTTLRGSTAVTEEQDPNVVAHLVMTARESGYSEHVARSMKLNKYMTAYSRDPETGKIEWIGGVEGVWDKELPDGAVILSDENENLNFNAESALACNFSRATCDNLTELAEYLNLPDGKWYESDDYGRKISEDWTKIWAKAKVDVPILTRNIQRRLSSQDPQELSRLLSDFKEALRWLDKAPMAFEENSFGLGSRSQVREWIEQNTKIVRDRLRRLRRR